MHSRPQEVWWGIWGLGRESGSLLSRMWSWSRGYGAAVSFLPPCSLSIWFRCQGKSAQVSEKPSLVAILEFQPNCGEGRSSPGLVSYASLLGSVAWSFCNLQMKEFSLQQIPNLSFSFPSLPHISSRHEGTQGFRGHGTPKLTKP
jgi:hypothetical protein